MCKQESEQLTCFNSKQKYCQVLAEVTKYTIPAPSCSLAENLFVTKVCASESYTLPIQYSPCTENTRLNI